MKRYIIGFAVATATMISSILPAQELSLENSLLWKIEHDSLEKSSYLFGTLHLMCEADFSIKEKVKTAMNATEQLVLEVNFSDPSELAALQSSAMSDTKLSETLEEDQLAKLSIFLKDKLGMSLEQVDNYSLSTIYSLSIMNSLSCANKKMFEVELLTMAMGAQKSIEGLETVEQQLEFLNKSYPPDFLLQQLDLFEEFQKSFEEMVEDYKKEDLNALSKMLMDERYMDDNAKEWLLTKRNLNWSMTIPGIISNKSSLIAVGAAHLVGEAGVIALLRKKGYTVTAVLE